ncbi:MAG TPA: S9 family peptidase [Ktedonobacteraceae bacterium]|nr:S9 family peptidase [Ktedonobacteraceae bacterium]
MSRSITIDDLYRIKFVGRPRISPDGKQVASVVTTIDERLHSYRSSIWITPADGGDPQRFTSGTANAGSPAWSPDGRWLAFVSEREGDYTAFSEEEQKDLKKLGKGKPQIWVISTSGGEARQLTFLRDGASQPTWSPDSKLLAFSGNTSPEVEETPDGKPIPQARVIDNLWYRLDGAGFTYQERQHLYLLSLEAPVTAIPLQLTQGDWNDSSPAWSPDGSSLAFTSSRQEDRWSFPADDIYTLAIEQGKPGTLRCLTDGNVSFGAPGWSRDGKTLAAPGAIKFGSAGHTSLYTISAEAPEGSQATNLTEASDISFTDFTNSDMGDEHLTPAPVWSEDGKTLYALGMYHGATRLYAVPVTGAVKEPETLTPANLHVRDFSADRSVQKFAVAIGTATTFPEIFVVNVAQSGEQRKLTNFNQELESELNLSAPEQLLYTGAEGWPMEGWILKPHDFDPSRKYPLIVEIHGGPHTQFGYGFFHEMQVMAAKGYVVLFTNPRGSSGYGRDFALAVRGDWGTKDSLDILAGVDALLAKGYIDENRVGVTGGSYGGFMTNWLVGKSDRFKAAVTLRSVTNLSSFFGSSDFGYAFAKDDFQATPWDNPEVYAEHSPITFAKNIHTPLLILHSEQDLRCHIEQADQLFATLKYLGREVQYVRFEGQSHGLSRGGHPKLRKERLGFILGWFDKYMG